MISPLSLFAAISSARYTLRYADIDDADAVVTTLATSLTAATVTAAGLNGTLANPGPALTKMHRLSVTTTAEAACYNTTDPIIATCTDQVGATRLLYATLVTAGGNETIEFTLADGSDAGALSVISYAIPAQLKNSGAFTFGVTDVVFDAAARQLRCGAAGSIVVEYEAESAAGTAITDTLTGIEGERHDVFVKKILDSAAATDAFPITAYI